MLSLHDSISFLKMSEPLTTEKANSLMKEDILKRERSKLFFSLRKAMLKRREEIEKLEKSLVGYSSDSYQYKEIQNQIDEKEEQNNKDHELYIQMDNEGVDRNYKEDEFCDLKLVEASEDIKLLKKDSNKFAKHLTLHI